MKLSNAIYFLILEFALIPLLFIGYIVFSYTKSQNVQVVLEKIDAIAQIQKNRLQNTINQEHDLLKLFSTRPLLLSYLRSYNARPTPLLQKYLIGNISEARAGSDFIREIFLANPTGKIVASTDESLIGQDVSGESFFMQGIKQEDFSFLVKDNSGSIFQYLVSPLSLDNKTIGMIALVVDAKAIIDIASDYSALGKTGETLLAKNDGQNNALFITPTRFDRGAGLVRLIPKSRHDIPSVHAVLGEEKIFTDSVDYREVPVFAATRAVSPTNWGIVVKIDRSEALAPINNLQFLFFVLFLGATILIVFLTLPFSRSILAVEEASNRERDELISLASHQLKSPITAISWYTELLLGQDKKSLNKKSIDILKEIRNINKNMLELIEGFLDLTKFKSVNFVLEKGVIDLRKVSDSVLEVLAGQIAAKKIKLIKRYENIPLINIGDRTARIILQNLLTNAVKYTPEGGMVEVDLKKSQEGISVIVKDNGFGIPESAKSRIFSKLFRANNIIKKVPSGTGLGLYLLKKLVDKVGGKIWFESKEGVGSTFYVLLPYSRK